ncbi:endogenous retrovirus group K member 8 Gag polyprotein-like isoform X2 [Tamandua tetradactyla]|uniref:endogenous retrovirus group K member 8 Gag polyprotein-like isoform X2 n=1 Tax=Tamandua tetradactyla TaxID=48850 RepID=UPI00405439B0
MLKIRQNIHLRPVLGGMNFEHEAIPFKLLKDLKQACAQYGANSPYATGFVQGMSQAARLIPWDWEMLALTVLSSAEYSQFKTWWSDEAMQTARRNADQQPPIPITAEKLTGTGAWTGLQGQLQYDDQAITQVRSTCLSAWRRIASPGSPTVSFGKIIQGSTEPYAEFVARLTDAVQKTVQIPEAKYLILLTLAFDSANSECKNAICPIKAGGSNLQDYIRACQDIGSLSHQISLLVAALRLSNLQQKKGNCYKCGKNGHFQRECRALPVQNKKFQQRPGPNKKCPICQKGFHWANECHSKYCKNGQPVTWGNKIVALVHGPQTNNMMSSSLVMPVSSGQWHASQSQK